MSLREEGDEEDVSRGKMKRGRKRRSGVLGGGGDDVQSHTAGAEGVSDAQNESAGLGAQSTMANTMACCTSIPSAPFLIHTLPMH